MRDVRDVRVESICKPTTQSPCSTKVAFMTAQYTPNVGAYVRRRTHPLGDPDSVLCTRSRIPDSNDRLIALDADAHTQLPTGISEAGGVGQQVHEYLFQTPLIGFQPHRHTGQLDIERMLTLLKVPLERLDGTTHCVAQIQSIALQVQFATGDPRHIEQFHRPGMRGGRLAPEGIFRRYVCEHSSIRTNDARPVLSFNARCSTCLRRAERRCVR